MSVELVISWIRVQLRVCRIKSPHPFAAIRSTTSVFVSQQNGFSILEWIAENLRNYPAKTGECLRVALFASPCAHNLCNRRKIEADDTIFEKEDALFAEQSCCNCAERSKQKGSCPVRRFSAELPENLRPDRKMEQPISAKPVP